MWKVFSIKDKSNDEFLPILESVRSGIMEEMTKKIKSFFANKTIVAFDNQVLFEARNVDHHTCLMEALSLSEKAMIESANQIFPRIEAYWVVDDGVNSLMFSHLDDSFDTMLTTKGFSLVHTNSGLSCSVEKLEFMTLKCLAFDIGLVNYINDWVDCVPSADERAMLLAKHVLVNLYQKKTNASILDVLNYAEKISGSKTIADLHKKIMHIMPKTVAAFSGQNEKVDMNELSVVVQKKIRLGR